MLATVLALGGTVVAALWRTLPEMADTARAVYHSIAGICRHTFQATQTEGVALAASGFLVGFILVLLRFTRYTVRRWRWTRQRVRLLLTARVTRWPPHLAAAASRLGIADWLDVVHHPAPFAFCHGFLRPRICISDGLIELLTAAELEAVLLHEDHHRRHRDPLLLLITSALAHALSFVPTVPELHQRYDTVKEFDADAAAVSRLGGLEPMASALYKVLTSPAAGPDLGTAAVRGLTATERRIDHLVAPTRGDVPPLSRPRLAVSSLIVGFITLPALALIAANLQPIAHACRL